MDKKSNRFEFWALLTFMGVVGFFLTNGFTARIFAQEDEVDIFEQVEPIGEVLGEILKMYYEDPDVDKIVEGALRGMMFSLDKHSSFIPPENYQEMTEDTEGEFMGIGVRIELAREGSMTGGIIIVQAFPGLPAAKEGIKAGDYIYKIDDISTEGMDTRRAAQLIKGPKGKMVKITVMRPGATPESEHEEIDFNIKRGKIHIDSVKEARMFSGGIGYVRVSDFRKNTAKELRTYLKDMESNGLKSLILDLRWNPGGLLTASKEMCELFLTKDTLVTYTKGREGRRGRNSDNMRLRTEREPLLPADMPIIVLVNDLTASSSEIVTGALQFYSRALIVGGKTYGKGSVQTIIPLRRPKNSALRLTTALYYTPAEVTINNHGILPDVEISMGSSRDDKGSLNNRLFAQLFRSNRDDPNSMDNFDHGLTGSSSDLDELVEDLPLKKAISILKESRVFADIIRKYHKDTSETQVAAREDFKEAS